MRSLFVMVVAAASVALAVPAEVAGQSRPDRPAAEKQKERPAQAARPGQGQNPGQSARPGQSQRPPQAQGRGQGQGPPSHARARIKERRAGPPPSAAAFNRDVVQRAVAVRGKRHGEGRSVTVRSEGDEVRVVRGDGEVLFALPREAAERLGYWRLPLVPEWTTDARQPRSGGGIFDRYERAEDRREDGSPAFCRSGEGHPVWGREWCLDKGFGLGGDDSVWGRATDIEDIVLRRPRTDRTDLDRGGLLDVLGDVVFGRLALQSVVVGADDPLTGRWIGQGDGPRVLRVRAGDLHIAELVDANRDDRVDVLLVNLGG